MAEVRRFLDVWLVEANTVYKEVPFNVVSDWIQQGRLLENDMLKPSGTKEWQRIGGSPDFAAYLPRALPKGVEDKAEALEPVEVGFSWNRPKQEEDDEIDMIPLIDVTLVLLIFFMMTAAPGASSEVELPGSYTSQTDTDHTDAGISIKLDGKTKEWRYSLSMGNVPSSDPADKDIQTMGEALGRLQVLLDRNTVPVAVTINAHEDVKMSLLLQLTSMLEKPPLRKKVLTVYRGVSVKQ